MSLERIQFLIDNLQEGLDVEVKNWLNGLQSNDDKAKLAKEIIALANHGGGYVFIGFEDVGEGHPELAPEAGFLEAFGQDAIASVVARYVHPPIQCTVSLHTRQGSDTSHPVITVPGKHRTPIWAARASPDQQTLKAGRIYIRRPGGASEEAQNQDDWEKLLERLVTARQSEQIDAIRAILLPPAQPAPAAQSLQDWTEESRNIWSQLVEPLHADDARRFDEGYWTFSFIIDPVDCPSLTDLNQFLERETPQYSGWRPFTYLHRDPGRPVPRGNEIQAWLARTYSPEPVQQSAPLSDFWRLSREGKGFSLRAYQEDEPNYAGARWPQPTARPFDWTIPTYRMVEFLKFVEAFGLRFGSRNSSFEVMVTYQGLLGRELYQHRFEYSVSGNGPASVDVIKTTISGPLYTIELSLEELIYSLLQPVYEQFGFTRLPKLLVDDVVRNALGYR